MKAHIYIHFGKLFILLIQLKKKAYASLFYLCIDLFTAFNVDLNCRKGVKIPVKISLSLLSNTYRRVVVLIRYNTFSYLYHFELMINPYAVRISYDAGQVMH